MDIKKIKKGFVITVVEFCTRLCLWLIRKFKIDYQQKTSEENLLFLLVRCINKRKAGNYYYAYKSFPKNELVVHANLATNKKDKYAVILQGPICREDNFTINTVKIYKKIFEDALIIVSTWKNERDDVLTELEKSSSQIHVVYSEYPQNTGFLNSNYQIFSTQKGIELAKELGAKYVFKTRTDQRMTKNNIYPYFHNLLEMFPVEYKKKNDKGYKPVKRLLVLASSEKNMFNAYYLPDYFYFGYIDDVFELFNSEMRNEETTYAEIQQKRKIYSNLQLSEEDLFVEVSIVKTYLRKIFEENQIECTIETYWEYVRKFFISVSKEDVGLLWYKYFPITLNLSKFYENNLESECDSLQHNFDLKNWLNVYCHSYPIMKEYDDYHTKSKYRE